MEEKEINKTEETDGNSENLAGDSVKSTLTQKQVDEIVRNRLQRQKKEHETELSQAKEEAESYKSSLSTLETFFTSMVEKQMKDLPEAVKEMFEKLPLSDKIEWLSKYSQSEEIKGFEKQGIPTTPKGSEGEKQFKPNTKNTFKI